MTSISYEGSVPEHDQRRTDSIAAQWTPEAQERYKFLKSIPAGNIPRSVDYELGYLEGYKNAAEEKDTK